MHAPMDIGKASGLRSFLLSADQESQRKVMEEIIAEQSSGRDMNYFFVDVVRLFRGKSLRIRRLVYIFISRCGALHAEKVLSVLEIIMNDLYSPNAHVRVLSLKCMASLSSINFVADAFIAPLCDILKNDINPFVKQTAVLCAYSIHRKSIDLFEKFSLLPILTEILHIERHPSVLASTAFALIAMQNKGGEQHLTLQEGHVTNILSALQSCSASDQLSLLNFLTLCKLDEPSDAIRVMDIACPLLQNSNMALVIQITQFCLAKIKIVQNDASSERREHQYFKMILGALRFHLEHTTEPECAHYILQVIHMTLYCLPPVAEILPCAPFFIQFSDTELVQVEKINILVFLAVESNVNAILNELEEYTKDIYAPYVSSRSVFAIAEVSLHIKKVSPSANQRLVQIFTTTTSQAVLEAIIDSAQYMIRYSDDQEANVFLATALIQANIRCTSEEAKLSQIWISGEYAQLPGSLSVLTGFSDSFFDESLRVQLAMLTACVKLYLRLDERPSEEHSVAAKSLLESVLQRCKEVNDPLMDDRLSWYKTLLDLEPSKAASIVFRPNLADLNVSVKPPRHIHCKYEKMSPERLINGLDDLPMHVVVRESSLLDTMKVKPHKKQDTVLSPAQIAEENEADSASVSETANEHGTLSSFDDLFVSLEKDSPNSKKAAHDSRKSFDFNALFA